jgi:hypothetical protein
VYFLFGKLFLKTGIQILYGRLIFLSGRSGVVYQGRMVFFLKQMKMGGKIGPGF